MAASNSIGIFLCIICMSYSLPYVPTRLLKNPNNKERLKQLQYEISLCKTLLTNMRIALVDNIAKLDIYQNHPHLNEELRPYLDEIKGRIPDSFYQRAMIHVRGIEQPDSKGKVLKTNKDVTLGKLVVLHKNVKHLREEITRLKMKQQCLIDNAVFIEDLLDSTYTFNSSMKDVTTSITNFNPSTSTRLRIRFMISIWPNLAKILGIVSAILSCLLILIEVLGLLNKSIEEFLKGIISRRDNWAVATISLTIFCYAIFTVHFAVFRFKFSGFYNLYYDHQTDTASLLYSGM